MRVEVVRLPGAGHGWYSVSEDDTVLYLRVEPALRDECVAFLTSYALAVEACLRNDPSLKNPRAYVPLPRMTKELTGDRPVSASSRRPPVL
ncbi:MAG: hypothetical protein GEU83_12110 [Pseudonocardiaceae bacterium]|nr:hypothetical protein [Pseudonocardiaceae bacterium]